MKAIKKCFSIFGPGLITGAADDDPSGIATYSQTGAQFGYGQLWTALFMLPFLIAVQGACARIGAVTGIGLTEVIKKNYNKKTLYGVVLLLLIANIINIGADIGAMAAAAELIIPINFFLLEMLFVALILFLEIYLTYKVYAKILKWLCLSLLAYPITVFMVSQPWMTLLKATFVPHIEFNLNYLFLLTGVFGTTISPYMFFWQTAQISEEKRESGLIKNGKDHIDAHFIKKMQIDNFFGMLFSEMATWAIIVVAATVLHAHGITDIKSSADAARALEPLVQTFPHSGYLAKLIFATGIIGLGLICVPILAGSAAYAITATFNFSHGLDKKFHQAPVFYVVIILATMVGLGFNLVGIDPIKALVWSAVINGVIAVPLIALIALIAKNNKVMGSYKSNFLSNILIWLAVIGMGLAAVGMFFTIF